jgi:hypothetical protein
MMNLLPSNYLAHFPVSWVEQNFTYLEFERQLDILAELAWDASLAREDPRPQNSTCIGRYPG